MSLSNSQYGQIMNRYDQIRYRQAREQNARIRELHSRIPELTSLEQQYSERRAALISNLANLSEQSMMQFQKETKDFLQKKEQLLTSHGYPADYDELRYDCPDCRDTGTLPDGSHCHCFQKQAISLVYESSNLSQIVERENFRTFTLDYFSKEEQDPASKTSIYDLMEYNREECQSFAAEFPQKPYLSLLLTGPTGTGKSFLAHCVAEELLRSGFSVIRLTASGLIEVFEDQMRKRSRYLSEDDSAEDPDEMDSDELRRYLTDCDLLIIDDLGTEMVNSFTVNKIFYIVDERLVRRKGTLITTNLTMAQLKETYTERISSRLFSGYRILRTAGSDVRMAKKRRE